ncbi:CPBP family intramembrane glutamic endopeptidase [Qipengyuania spongiae]|uniref:CPBP family intramembrane metalloprotease n=1 Tax=Qipengyuania spongiae TaxID=2909673 RepID=A0ABY5SZD7_9SPHN|nr:CPBP family intramembrane glutamic endopeptidase [Qipengyuania spongiae]UVI39700.1 CPBP family intramembrane metalloprotease [Qipengyuania spongiae]
MDDDITSPERGRSLRAEWAALIRFVARPRLPERTAPFSRRSLIALVRIYGLDLALMGVLALIAGMVVSAGRELPETALAGMEITAGLALAVILGAPVMEEVIFRGWLSGRKRQFVALATLIAGGLSAGILGASAIPGGGIWMIGVVVLFAGLAGLLFWTGRNRTPMRWFSRAFPLFFWLSTIAFACIHLANFDEGTLWVLLPLVLPQFLLGVLLGYLRVHYGLWASIALHALHNGTALGLVWIGLRFAGAEG